VNPFDDNLDDNNTADDAADTLSEYDSVSTEESERKVGSEPVPSFGFYVLAPKGATPAFEFEDKQRPVARHRFEVVEGPDGTIGQSLFADQKLYAAFNKWTDQKDAQGRPVMDPLDSEERAEAILKFDRTMNRVARCFNLMAKKPKDKSMVAIGVYCAQFDKSTSLIVSEVKKQTRNGFTKNVIWFDSIASLMDPTSKDYRGKAKTAHEEAKEKIVAKNLAIATADKKAGRAPRGNNKSTTASSSPQSLD
jgi:hypothetical protein